MPVLGKSDIIILMGAAMFICLVAATQNCLALPASLSCQWPEKIVMGGAIILSVMLSRSFM